MLVSVVVILSLMLVVGLLNGAQTAVAAARRARLEAEARVGSYRSQAALRLVDNQEAALAATRVAVAIVVVATSLFAGGPIAQELTQAFMNFGLSLSVAEGVSFFSLVVGISFSLVTFGELIPAGLAQAYPEAVSRALAPSVVCMLSVTSPFASFASGVVGLLLRPFKREKEDEAEELEEDIKSLVDEGQRAGVIEAGEKEIINRVFKLDDKPVASLMTPRADVELIKLQDAVPDVLAKAAEARHTWLPVVGDTEDDVVGIVSIHDLMKLERNRAQYPQGIRNVLVDPLEVPKSMTALKLLELFRENASRLAIVRDEYGGMSGIVTVYDVLQVIVGDISDTSEGERQIVEREDGSLLVDAATDVYELFERLEIRDELPVENGKFHSLGGFVMTALGYVPKEGERFSAYGFSFEVVDMDNNRIDKVLVAKEVEKQLLAS